MTVEQCKSRGGLVAFEKCFTAPVLSGDRSINYTEAEKECKTRKTLLAEIDDGSQQTTIHDYLFSMMPPGRKYVYLWLGMQYNYEVRPNLKTLLRYCRLISRGPQTHFYY